MVIAAEESADFAAIADSLLINVGTVTPADAEGMTVAARSAHAAGTPWVLDPVAVGALRYRTDFVATLLEHRPTVIRGNASEILALAGSPEQKDRYLHPLLAGDLKSAFSMTEPDTAGSDVLNSLDSARRRRAALARAIPAGAPAV